MVPTIYQKGLKISFKLSTIVSCFSKTWRANTHNEQTWFHSSLFWWFGKMLSFVKKFWDIFILISIAIFVLHLNHWLQYESNGTVLNLQTKVYSQYQLFRFFFLGGGGRVGIFYNFTKPPKLVPYDNTMVLFTKIYWKDVCRTCYTFKWRCTSLLIYLILL